MSSTTLVPCPSILQGDRALAAELGVEWMACSRCGREFPISARSTCAFCSGALEIIYDFAMIRGLVSRATIAQGPRSLWRYADLLPVPRTGLPEPGLGLTPLRETPRLAAELGLHRLWLKDESHDPSGSSQDRAAAVARMVARRLGLESHYRDSIADLTELRTFSREGWKTVAFEIAEQLGWRPPDVVVVPVSSGCPVGKVAQGFDEFSKVGLLPEGCAPEIIGAQADGPTPVVEGIGLLARTEGVRAGPAAVAALERLVHEGRISPYEEVVAVITRAD